MRVLRVLALISGAASVAHAAGCTVPRCYEPRGVAQCPGSEGGVVDALADATDNGALDAPGNLDGAADATDAGLDAAPEVDAPTDVAVDARGDADVALGPEAGDGGAGCATGDGGALALSLSSSEFSVPTAPGTQVTLRVDTPRSADLDLRVEGVPDGVTLTVDGMNVNVGTNEFPAALDEVVIDVTANAMAPIGPLSLVFELRNGTCVVGRREVSITLRARPGLRDRTYTGAVVSAPSRSFTARALRLDPSGRLFAAGSDETSSPAPCALMGWLASGEPLDAPGWSLGSRAVQWSIASPATNTTIGSATGLVIDDPMRAGREPMIVFGSAGAGSDLPALGRFTTDGATRIPTGGTMSSALRLVPAGSSTVSGRVAAIAPVVRSGSLTGYLFVNAVRIPGGVLRLMLGRVLPNGEIDTSFGTEGFFDLTSEMPMGFTAANGLGAVWSAAIGLASSSDGSALISIPGSVSTGPATLFLMRTSSGAPSTTFRGLWSYAADQNLPVTQGDPASAMVPTGAVLLTHPVSTSWGFDLSINAVVWVAGHEESGTRVGAFYAVGDVAITGVTHGTVLRFTSTNLDARALLPSPPGEGAAGRLRKLRCSGTPQPGLTFRAVVARPSGQGFVAAGYCVGGSGGSSLAAPLIGAFNAEAALDTNFVGTGVVADVFMSVTSLDPPPFSRITALTVAPTGMLYALFETDAGSGSTTRRFQPVRYYLEGPTPTP